MLVPIIARSLAPAVTGSLFLSALGCRVELRCRDRKMRAVLDAVYGALCVTPARSELRVTIGRTRGRLLLACEGEPVRIAADEDELLAMLDELIVVHLQRRRPELFFVHSAVLELEGRAVLLVAPSGAGKSTTTWALAHHGFRYVTDELAPIDMASLSVHAFPRALHLKAEPPADYPMTTAATRIGATIRVAPEHLPDGFCREPLPLGMIVFLHRTAGVNTSAIWPVSAAEAAAHLVANALNPLAHSDSGLDAAVAVANGAACFSLRIGDLGSACRLLRATMEGVR